VAVPAGERAALEVVQAEAVFEFAVVVLDPPPDLGQAGQLGDGGIGGQVRKPVIGRLFGAGGPFGQQPALCRLPSGARGMSRLAGRTRVATKWLVMAASGLPLLALAPCRQVTGWI
jgi:hypothetical protein